VDGHQRILVSAVRFVALANRRSSGHVDRRLVIDDHVLTRQRQLDSNVDSASPRPVPVRYFEYNSASDDCRIERFEPRDARVDRLLERRNDSHLAETDLYRSHRHDALWTRADIHERH